MVDRSEPLRLVARSADGSWQFLDGLPIDVDHLMTTHAHHPFDEFPADLQALRRMPPGYQAIRDSVDSPWRIEPYMEEE